MSRHLTRTLLVALMVTLAADNASAISRVSRSLNYLQVFTSYAKPVGETEFYNVIGPSPNFDTEDLYKDTYSFGLSIGQVRAERFNWDVGLRYTKLSLDDRIDRIFDGTEGLSFNLYDLELNVNYYFSDVATVPFAPYVGIGLAAGLMSPKYEQDSYDYDSELKAAAGLNFGFDLRLVRNQDGSQVSLVSLNRYDFMATTERPHYLNFGLALRYYVRP